MCFVTEAKYDSSIFPSTDGNLKTDGFSIESCRSMVAVMDASFSL